MVRGYEKLIRTLYIAKHPAATSWLAEPVPSPVEIGDGANLSCLPHHECGSGVESVAGVGEASPTATPIITFDGTASTSSSSQIHG